MNLGFEILSIHEKQDLPGWYQLRVKASYNPDSTIYMVLSQLVVQNIRLRESKIRRVIEDMVQEDME